MTARTCWECGTELDERGNCPVERAQLRVLNWFFALVAVGLVAFGWWLA
jgi:hypothetical protein